MSRRPSPERDAFAPVREPETDGKVVLDDTFPSIREKFYSWHQKSQMWKMKRDEKVDVRVRNFEDEMKRGKGET